jgi:hypothetical protein
MFNVKIAGDANSSVVEVDRDEIHLLMDDLARFHTKPCVFHMVDGKKLVPPVEGVLINPHVTRVIKATHPV